MADGKLTTSKRFTTKNTTYSGPGEGLIIYDNVILPFVDKFPTNIELYRLLTTRLSEVVGNSEDKEKAE